MILLGMIFMGGCSSIPPVQIYKPNPPDPNVRTTSLKVAVVELEDSSPADEISYAWWGAKGTHYGKSSFGRCLAKELKASRLFSSVEYFSNWYKPVRWFTD